MRRGFIQKFVTDRQKTKLIGSFASQLNSLIIAIKFFIFLENYQFIYIFELQAHLKNAELKCSIIIVFVKLYLL